MLPYLLSGITLGFSAAVSPGPFQAYLLNQTVNNGWKRALPACLAPLISDGPIILLVVVLLAQTPDWFLDGLKIGGGFYLFYLAYEALHRLPDN